MRRALSLLVLSTLAVPPSWASGRSHTAAVVHARTLVPAASAHTHAPGVFPRANPGESNATDTKAAPQNAFAAFITRTMLGFSARFSH